MCIYRREHMKAVLLVATVCLLQLSCTGRSGAEGAEKVSAEEKTAFLVAESIKHTGALVPSSNLNELFFKRYGIPGSLEQGFVALYERLRSELQQVRRCHQRRESVRYFLLNRYLLHLRDSIRDFETVRYLAAAENPVYMAFSLKVEELPMWGSIGSPGYIKTLARSLGAREIDVAEGVWVLLRNNSTAVLEAVALMLKTNLEDSRSALPDFFFTNILVPYLTYVSKRLPVYGPVEDKVFATYERAFRCDDGANALEEFATAFKRYLSGHALKVSYVNALNSCLGRYKYRVYVADRTCIGYRVQDYRIRIRRGSIGDVVFLKKTSVCLSMGFLGLSTTNERDVIITVDEISDYADDITYALENKRPVISAASRFPDVWTEMNTGLSADSADKVSFALMDKEFGGLSRSRMINRLITQLAVHEVKHKWDEARGADAGWYNLDCETSAYLAEIVYGGTPFYSLLSFVFRYQEFYEGIPREYVREKIRPVLRRCWGIAAAVSSGAMGRERLKKEITEIYSTYEPIAGGALPPLDEYHDGVVAPCLTDAPELRADSPLVDR